MIHFFLLGLWDPFWIKEQPRYVFIWVGKVTQLLTIHSTSYVIFFLIYMQSTYPVRDYNTCDEKSAV